MVRWNIDSSETDKDNSWLFMSHFATGFTWSDIRPFLYFTCLTAWIPERKHQFWTVLITLQSPTLSPQQNPTLFTADIKLLILCQPTYSLFKTVHTPFQDSCSTIQKVLTTITLTIHSHKAAPQPCFISIHRCPSINICFARSTWQCLQQSGPNTKMSIPVDLQSM